MTVTMMFMKDKCEPPTSLHLNKAVEWSGVESAQSLSLLLAAGQRILEHLHISNYLEDDENEGGGGEAFGAFLVVFIFHSHFILIATKESLRSSLSCPTLLIVLVVVQVVEYVHII